MKGGDRLVQAIRRRNELKLLWTLLNSPELKRDTFDWADFFKVNKN